MSQPLACPNCRATHRVESVGVGQSFACPKCQHTWTPLPRPTAATPKKAVRVLDAEEMATPSAEGDQPKKKARKTKTPETLSPMVLVGFVAAGVAVMGVLATVAWLVMRPVERTVPTETAKPATTATTSDSGSTTKPTGQPPAASRPRNDPLFLKMLNATALVLVEDPTNSGQPFFAAGSGVLVHRQRKLVVTSHRTAQVNDRVAVMFPTRRLNDELNTDLKYYLESVKALGVPGKVVHRNPQADLALVELERVPSTADELKFASLPIVPGAELFSLGASDVNVRTGVGTLWQFSQGSVRKRYKDAITFPDRQMLNALVIESTKHLPEGDGGGPTVNAVGELVGMAFVNPSARETHRLDVDAHEIQEFLKAYALKGGWSWGGSVVAAPASSQPTAPPTPAVRIDVLAGLAEKGTVEQRVAALRDLTAFGPDARKVVPKLLPLLDESEVQVREAAVAALQKIGDPLPDDAWCLGKALTAAGPHARAHALRTFGSTQRLPVEHLPRVIAWLGVDTPDLRVLAAGALANYGPECKDEAFKPLSLMAIDENSTVADAAVAALTKFAPYRGADFRWLTERAGTQNVRVRRFVIGQIGADAESVDLAAKYLTPALTDPDAKVREAAAFRFARWGKAALPHVEPSTLLKLMDDPDPAAKLAAIRMAGAVEAQPALPKLLAAMKGEAKEVREAAAEAVANLDLTDGTHGTTAITQLLDSDSPIALVKTFEKLAAAKLVTKERVPSVAKALKRTEPAVRNAALTALASAGATAATQAEAVAALITDDDAKQSEQAIDTLVQLGKTAAEPLAKRLDQRSNATVKAQICRAVGRYGSETPAVAVVYLIAEGEKSQELRAEVSDAVAAISTDDTVTGLRPLVSWSLNAKKQRTSKYPADVQVWALQTMARLDPNKLSEAERKRLMDGLRNQSDVDPDATCRREASAALAKLKAKVKTK